MTAVTLTLLQLTSLILELKAGSHPVYLYSAAGTFAASSIICYLSFLNHSRCQKPFDVLNIVLFLSVSRDIVQIILLHLTGLHRCQISTLNVTLITVKVVLLILELQSKRSILREPWRDLSFEETENFFSRAFFLWVNSLLQRGRNELFEVKDLPPLPRKLTSKLLRERMKQFWEGRCKSFYVILAPIYLVHFMCN